MRHKKFLVGFDLHGDKQDDKAVKAFLEFDKIWNPDPDYRIFGGDLWDFRPLRGRASDDEKRESMVADFKAGMRFMEEWKPRVYLRGNHSLVRDTEILTTRGWIRCDSLMNNDEVAQVDRNKRITFARPLECHVTEVQKEVVELKGAFTHHVVTNYHNLLIDGEKVKAADVVGKKIPYHSLWRSGFLCSGEKRKYDSIRLLTWFIMDGTFVDCSIKNPKHKKARIQFKLSKPRKIKMLKELLDRNGISYTFRKATKSGINKLQPYRFCIYGDWARNILDACGRKKRIPFTWTRLSIECVKVFLETLAITDGSMHDGNIAWTTTSREDMETVCLMCIFNGIDFQFKERINASGFENSKLQYACTIRLNTENRQYITPKIIPHNDVCFCVTMPEGTLFTRYKGKVMITGNCERLWELAQKDDGVRSDYAMNAIGEIEKTLKVLRCTMLPYHKSRGVWTRGELKVLHGFYHGVGAGMKHATIYGSCLTGHVHSIGAQSTPAWKNNSVASNSIARSCGCLCDLDMDYAARTPYTLQHAHGWAYGVIDEKSGKYHVWQAEKQGNNWILPMDITVLKHG